MLKPALSVGGLLHETVFQTFSSPVQLLTLYINFSGAQYDKIAVDVDKSSIIYKTDIHVHDN